jgi:hypothetical protein
VKGVSPGDPPQALANERGDPGRGRGPAPSVLGVQAPSELGDEAQNRGKVWRLVQVRQPAGGATLGADVSRIEVERHAVAGSHPKKLKARKVHGPAVPCRGGGCARG